MREIVLDTETTGLDPISGHRIVEIGCVELLNHVSTGKIFHQYINPERDMPVEAFKIHGLSNKFLSTKPKFAEIIISDVLDDLAYFDNKTYLDLMDGLYNRIRFSGPTFWEDTDRGNTNIYFSPDSDIIDDFKKILSKQMKKRLTELDRDVQFLRLELDQLQAKDKDGKLTQTEKTKIIELEEKISTRRKTFFIG